MKPVVSVLCHAYNHGQFVERALDSVVSQELDVPFEIIVHDDASTDGTSEITRCYAEKYPHLIRLISQSHNQYAKGIKPPNFTVPQARGDFVAFCEMDDWWCDSSKLQKQYDALVEHSELDLSFHSAIQIDWRNGNEKEVGRYRRGNGVVALSDILEKRYGQIPTASLFLRRRAIDEFFEFFSARPWLTVGDVYLQFFGGWRGGAYFLDEPMSYYRSHTEGSWTARQSENVLNRISHAKARVYSFRELDELSSGVFHESFRNANRMWYIELIKFPGVPYRERIKLFFEGIHDLRLSDCIYLAVFAFFPAVINFYRACKRMGHRWVRQG